MPYIKRDEQGAICAISQTQTADFDEAIDVDAAELTSFLSQWNAGKNDLNESDLGFIRVLEDLIELLINKNLICFTDLPDAAAFQNTETSTFA